MCQTGGPRCYNEAHPAALAAQATYFAAEAEYEMVRDRPESLSEWRTTPERDEAMRVALKAREDARIAYLGAIADVYATSRGQEEIDQHFGVDVDFPFTLEQVQAEAEYRKRRGKIVRGIRSAEGSDLSGVLGQTGDEHTDMIVTHAAREYAADHTAHDKAPDLIPAVKQYANAEEKERGVARWARRVQDEATMHSACIRRLACAQEDVELAHEVAQADPSSTVSQQRLHETQTLVPVFEKELRQSRTRLVVMADKLRIAQTRQVPADTTINYDLPQRAGESLGAYLERTGQAGAWMNETMQMADEMQAQYDWPTADRRAPEQDEPPF